MGYVDRGRGASRGAAWLDELRAAGRVVREGDRWFAAEATRDPKTVLRGRLEALGPVSSPATTRCSSSSSARASCCARASRAARPGATAVCSPASIATRSTGCGRRSSPSPRPQFLRFLACWQHVDREHRLEGPRGVARGRRAARRLRGPRGGVGGERAARARPRLPARVARPADALGRGRVGAALGRAAPPRSARADLPRAARGPRRLGRALRADRRAASLRGRRSRSSRSLASRGAMFLQELARATKLPPATSRRPRGARRARPRDLRLFRRPALADRAALAAPRARRRAGRWSSASRGLSAARPRGTGEALERRVRGAKTSESHRRRLPQDPRAARSCRFPGATSPACCRTLEARGEVRGGRFVAGFDGEQYALPEAVTLCCAAVRRRGEPGGAADRVGGRPAELPRNPHPRRARRPDDAQASPRRLASVSYLIGSSPGPTVRLRPDRNNRIQPA